MTVVEGWFAGVSYNNKVPDMLDLPEAIRKHLELNIAMNSKVWAALYALLTCHQMYRLLSGNKIMERCS